MKELFLQNLEENMSVSIIIRYDDHILYEGSFDRYDYNIYEEDNVLEIFDEDSDSIVRTALNNIETCDDEEWSFSNFDSKLVTEIAFY